MRARVPYARDRRTEDVRPFPALHDDGTPTGDDHRRTRAIPRYREKRGWSEERVSEYFTAKSNACVRYVEEPA